MRIFLSGMESININKWLEVDPDIKFKWTLMSYHFIRGMSEEKVNKIIDMSEFVLIDSGAHTYQKGKSEADWDKLAREYGEWIAKNDSEKMVGFFELDIDNVIGYDRVKEFRHELMQYSKKIIPVWHTSRGIDEFETMCKETSGGVVSFSGVADNINMDDMKWMTKTAWDNNCRIHALGITSKYILDRIPFDYVDSTSWVMSTVYGNMDTEKDRRLLKRVNGMESVIAKMAAYDEWKKRQDYYYQKWRGVSPVEV